MRLTELLIPEFDAEMTATRRVLERVPEGKSSWQPHPKSMTLEALGSTKQILELFDRNAKAARAALTKTTDTEFEAKVPAVYGPSADEPNF